MIIPSEAREHMAAMLFFMAATSSWTKSGVCAAPASEPQAPQPDMAQNMPGWKGVCPAQPESECHPDQERRK